MRYALPAKPIPSSSMRCTATANNAARASRFQKSTEADYIALKTKLTSLVSFAPMVTVCVDVPSFSCHALMVYVPGGRLLRSKLPSLPVTAKNGCLNTATYPCIQGCRLHFTGIAISSRANDSSTLDPGGSALFHSRLFAGVGWMLCDVGSPFTTFTC